MASQNAQFGSAYVFSGRPQSLQRPQHFSRGRYLVLVILTDSDEFIQQPLSFVADSHSPQAERERPDYLLDSQSMRFHNQSEFQGAHFRSICAQLSMSIRREAL